MASSLIKRVLVSFLVLTFQNCSAVILAESLTNEEAKDTNYYDDFNIHNIISNIYKNDFGNFEKVHLFAIASADYNFKVGALFGLYKAMVNAHHTDFPIKALTLYIKLEEIINDSNSRLLSSKSLNELQRIREEILQRTIVPKSANILVDNIFYNGFSDKDIVVSTLVELLPINNTVFILTIEHMIKKNSWLTHIELINVFAKLTPSPELNADLLLLLNDIYKFQGDEHHIFTTLLIQSSKNLNFTNSISAERKRRIDAVVARPLQILLAGRVCFYQTIDQIYKIYLRRDVNSYKMSLFDIDAHEDKLAALNVEIKRRPLSFNFRSVYFDNQPMYLKPNKTDGIDNLSFDPYILNKPMHKSDINDEIDIEWKVQIEGEQVALQNRNGTEFLCVEKYVPCTKNQKDFVLHKEKCKWYIENC